MNHGSLFSGIGGFDYAAQLMGWTNKFHCEWNPFGQKVLKYYWPEAESYSDITKTDFTLWSGKIDILTGGFPCQPYSTAGKRLGKEDDRHLWPEMLRAIREIQPRYVVGENVSGLINWNGGMVFEEVQADLEAEGYEVRPFILPACAVNAPHRRDRIWFIAYSNCLGRGRRRAEESERWEDVRRETTVFGTSEGLGRIEPSTDSTSNRRQREGKGIEIENRKQKSGNTRIMERGSEGLCESGIASDTKNNRFQEPIDSRRRRLRFENLYPDKNASYPCDERLQRGKFDGSPDPEGQIGGKQSSGSASEFHQVSDWRDFPTQSPVCSRNDGISERLDSDALLDGKNPRQPWRAFGKWRNESIKAAGNAIVPQVAVQIFQAINEFEKQLTV